MPVKSSNATSQLTNRVLFALGMVSLAIYGTVWWLSASFAPGSDVRDRPILAVLGWFALAFACYLGALAWLLRPGKGVKNRSVLGQVIAFAIAFRVLLTLSTPIQEIDYFRYLWDGRVCSAGISPYRFAPEQVKNTDPSTDPSDTLGKLQAVSRQSDSVRKILHSIHFGQFPTVYPPVAQGVFTVAAWLTPASAPVWFHVIAVKALFVLFDIGTLFLVVGLLRRLKLPTSWCLAYAWCPLVLKEIANSGHLDSIAVFFTTLAIYLLVVAATGKDKTGLWLPILSFGSLAVGILSKNYPIVLLPVLTAYLVPRLRWRSLLPLTACGLIVVVGYLPFFAPPASISTSEAQTAKLAPTTHHPLSSLQTFLTRWQMNDFLFMLVQENLRPSEPGRDHAFVLTSNAWRRSVVERVGDVVGGLGLEHADPSFLLTQAIMGSILLLLCCCLAWRVLRKPDLEKLLNAAFLTLIWAWLLSSAQNPWYLVWSMPLMIFAKRRSYFLLSGLVLIYYVRFWMAYHGYDVNIFHFGLVWLEYMPFFVALVVESLRPPHFMEQSVVAQLPPQKRRKHRRSA